MSRKLRTPIIGPVVLLAVMAAGACSRSSPRPPADPDARPADRSVGDGTRAEGGAGDGPAADRAPAVDILPADDLGPPDRSPVDYGPLSDALVGPWVVTVAGNPHKSGNKDGPAGQALFGFPADIAVDQLGRVFVADSDNHVIRMIQGGKVSTVAGRPHYGTPPGPFKSTAPATQEELWSVGTVAAVKDTVYFGDRQTCIRKLTPSGMLTTLAGNATLGQSTGSASQTRFARIVDLWAVAGKLYVRDTGDLTGNYQGKQIVEIEPTTGTSGVWVAAKEPWVALSSCKSSPGLAKPCVELGRLDRSVSFSHLVSGYVAFNYSLLGYDKNKIASVLSTWTSTYGSGPPHALLGFKTITGMQLHAATGLLFVAERSINLIRVVDPKIGAAKILAGQYQSGTAVLDAPAKFAKLGGPRELAYDAKNNVLYFIDGYAVRAVLRAM